ncbi:hypothetical protein AB0O28_18925 [Microbispora sp. NPDC088329]|uniref:hypothetical protein n=1 Tax=Microbispora sp. NPDC088329 TaxID=3154869 RepID=UPI003437FBA4
MTHEDIRRRLEAVEGLDWNETQRETSQEYHGDWVRVGPVMMQSTDPNEEPWEGYPSAWPEERRREYRERARAERAEEDAVVEFLKHAAGDLRRLLAERAADQHAQTRKETIMTNPIYGKPEPERGEPVRFLADAVEVLRPNGKVVRMDLVALADVAIGAERALAELRRDNQALRERVDVLEAKVARQFRAGRILAGEEDDYGPDDEDLVERVRALELEGEQRRQSRLEQREREDG